MPYARRRRRRRARRRRRRRGGTLAKRVRTVLASSAETKWVATVFDDATTPVPTDATNSIRVFPEMEIGTGAHERIGSEIRVTSFRYRLMLHNEGDAVRLVRFLIYRPKGQSVSGTTLKQTPWDNTAGFYAPVDTDKFVVMHQRWFRLGGVSAAQANVPGVVKLFYTKTFPALSGPKVIYDVDTGVGQVTPSKGMFLVAMVTNLGGVKIRYDGSVIVKYKDI